jgi:uncharacterized protein YfaS (alpha-2-macroglobulin family)
MFLTGAVSAVGGVLNSWDISKKSESGGMTGAFIEPEVRVNFSDTALWLPALNLDASGRAETEIQFPQSLTTWRVRAYAVTKSTQVGDTSGEAITTKNLLVRLQAPRFFVERDEVVLSANVHNYLATDKKVQVELAVPSDLFEALDLADGQTSQGASAPGDARGASQLLQQSATPVIKTGGAGGDEGGVVRLTLEAEVKANGEHRFNWPVRVKQSGFARITVKALTDEESDGVALAFPVLVHGVQKTLAQSGAYRVADQGAHSIQLDLPRDIDPEMTRLEITLSPSLAGVMIDALPYLVGYPYGCVEQTMSRFYPSVLVKETLRKMGTDLETIGRQRRQMNTNDLENRFRTWESPVFDSGELDRIVRAGLDRIYSLQRNDGGWGWWREDESSPYQTVVMAGRDEGCLFIES